MDKSWTRGGPAGRHLARRLARRDPEIVNLLDLVAAELGVPASMLLARSRCRAEIADARWLAMYLAHVALGRPIHVLARLFRRNWSTVSRACMRLEDQRERPEVDAFLDRMEAAIAATNKSERKPTRREARRAAR